MELSHFNKKWFIFFIYFVLLQGCDCYQSIDIGPLNITRTEGEKNVFIPCPFLGMFSPTWEINGVLYEPFDLPFPYYLAASRGLRIPLIITDMNGTSFRCYYPSSNGLEVVGSTIGFLHVKDRENFTPNMLTIFLTNTLYIDHQRLYFGQQNKIIAWRSSQSSGFQMVSKSGCCRESPVRGIWENINSTEVTISNDDLVYDSSLLNFNISNDLVSLTQSFKVDTSVLTRKLKASSSKGIDFEVMPREVNNTLQMAVRQNSAMDCICPLIFIGNQKCFDFTKCCINETAFINSIQLCKNEKSNIVQQNYMFQLKNLTEDIDNARIHFLQSFNCRDCDPPLEYSFRLYIESYEILVVIPEKPKVLIDERGEVCIISQNGTRNLPDFYDIIVYDITGQSIVEERDIPSSTFDCISLGNVFHDKSLQCSPFIVSVSAENTFGMADTEVEFQTNGHVGDICLCLNERVNTRLSNFTSSKTSVAMELLCEQVNYTSSITFKIIAIGPNVEIINTTCNDNESSNVYLQVNGLECNKEYNISVYWISQNEMTECLVAFNETSTANCSASINLGLIVGLSVGIGVSVVFVTLLCLNVCSLCCIKKKPYHRDHYNINQDNRESTEKANKSFCSCVVV